MKFWIQIKFLYGLPMVYLQSRITDFRNFYIDKLKESYSSHIKPTYLTCQVSYQIQWLNTPAFQNQKIISISYRLQVEKQNRPVFQETSCLTS